MKKKCLVNYSDGGGDEQLYSRPLPPLLHHPVMNKFPYHKFQMHTPKKNGYLWCYEYGDEICLTETLRNTLALSKT